MSSILRSVSAIGRNLVSFSPALTVPEMFKDRKFSNHNATVTLMRMAVEDRMWFRGEHSESERSADQ